VRAADYLSYTWRNISRAHLRLLLTVAAVVIGAMLVVVMTSVGGGIQRNVLEDIRSAGGLNEILVSSAFASQPGAPGGGRGGVVTDGAAETIQAISGVIAVLPEIVLPFGAVQLAYESLTAQPLVVGVRPEQMAPYGFTASQGNVAPGSGQVVLGAGVADRFFDANRQRATPPDLFGQTVSLGAQRFNSAPQAPPAAPGFGAPQAPPGFGAAPPQPVRRDTPLEVVGVLSPTGTQDDYTAWMNVEDLLDLLEWLTGRRPDLSSGGYQAMRVKTAAIDQVRPVQQAITALDFQATSPLSVQDEVNRGMLLLQALLGAIGLVALIVSGLGVANTMLMAAFERTREIGILKALGATESQIARLFLFEASFIGILGALVGLALGWLATQVINLLVLTYLAGSLGAAPGAPRAVLHTPGWVPLAVILLAWLVAMVAGLYPALRASHLNIARALRAE
jgi:putative ABC transport system permease protein